jgi:hypothetical protein
VLSKRVIEGPSTFNTHEACFASAIEDWLELRSAALLPPSACCGADVKVEGCRRSLRRALAQQYYFQLPGQYRLPLSSISRARTIPPSCIECQHPLR